MNSEKLNIKDFITIGIYGALYMIGLLVASVANIIPITYLFYPAVCALINGVVFMLIITKVQKKGAILLLGAIQAFYFALTGGFVGMISAISVLLFAGLAELVIAGKNRKDFKRMTLVYIIFSCGLAFGGGSFQLTFLTDQHLAGVVDTGLSSEYVDILKGYTSFTYWILVLAVNVLAALVGAFIGKLLLKKHLERAGIV